MSEEQKDFEGEARRVAKVSRRSVITLLALAPSLAMSGCGYSLAGRGSFLPSDIKVVGVPMLLNSTTFLDVETLLTERIREELIGRGRYRVVPSDTGADALLKGTITGVSVAPAALNAQQFASRYTFALSMSVEFRDLRTNDVLWSNSSMTFRGEYELNTSGAAVVEGATFVAQERAAFDRIATDVARTVVTAVLEAF